ncbi:MAG TPA: amidohydrolase [Thermomicrobiales bacterium]
MTLTRETGTKQTTLDATKDRVTAAIQANRDAIYAVGDAIYEDPELGFKEVHTAERVAASFDRLGLPYRTNLGITGVKAVLDSGRPGPSVCIIGELDSIIVFDHPDANPQTGAAHCCGHNCQIAGMLAAATGIVESGAIDHLSGKLVFLAVPAEEYVELDYRARLKQEGKLEFLGGKSELVRLGEFDDVDIAIMMHSGAQDRTGAKFTLAGTNNGFLGKLIRYTGHPTHAGIAPDLGVNALNAAMVGLMSIHANRETFSDDDSVRVHPIITRGGDLVNVVPSDVRMETYVRGRSMEAVLRAAKKVDRALKAGALAVGAEVEITTVPGYLPVTNDPALNALFKANVLRHFSEREVNEERHMAGSSDIGDLAHIMPVIQPSMNGSRGTFHGNDYAIADKEISYLWNGILMAETALDLLWGDGTTGADAKAHYDAPMTKDEYLAFLRGVSNSEVFGDVEVL